MQEGKRNSKAGKILLIIGALAIIVSGIFAYLAWSYLKKPNINLHGKGEAYLYIPTGGSFQNVKDSLAQYLENESSFEFVATRKHYPEKVKPGRYRLTDGMSNNALVNELRAGLQEPVKLSFSNARTRADLAKKLTAKLEIKPQQLDSLLNSNNYLQPLGFDTTTITGMFIPNTYEVLWTIKPDELVTRMHEEYEKFWTPERRQKAEAMNLTPKEVSTLASIVQSETNKADERPRVAGVYVNRLQMGMPLEADPTVVFALGDFSKQRVLNRDKAVESPYNTYKYKGLPPGPICVPDPVSINAVLNYEKHNYLYFCAKEDFSGYSNFACTLSEHMQNARRYQQELNRRHIMK
jgi:UPF0755 protein